MDTNNLTMRVRREPWDNTVSVLLGERDEVTGQLSVVRTMVVDTLERGAMVTPSFRMTEANAQALFNELWNEGFRPKDGTGNSGHIAALSAHLADMRRLVFGEK
jgi:hypothetical protein